MVVNRFLCVDVYMANFQFSCNNMQSSVQFNGVGLLNTNSNKWGNLHNVVSVIELFLSTKQECKLFIFSLNSLVKSIFRCLIAKTKYNTDPKCK